MLDTAVVPVELKPFLSLYLEVLFESPILRDGGKTDETFVYLKKKAYIVECGSPRMSSL